MDEVHDEEKRDLLFLNRLSLQRCALLVFEKVIEERGQEFEKAYHVPFQYTYRQSDKSNT